MSNWINHVKSYADKNKVSYKDAMSSSKCREDYNKNKLKGGYLPPNLKLAKTVLEGRNDLRPKVRNILSKYGNDIIVNYILKRTPVSSLLRSALSAVSFGEFGKRYKESEYDDLFHLFLELTTQSGKKIIVEKNEVINLEVSQPARPKEEVEDILNFPSGITLNQLLQNTKDRMGQSDFLKYSAKDNNCQDFIINVLDANNIGDESDREFVKQDTDFLFENLPFLRKFSNTVTTIGARANVVTTGAGKKKLSKKIIEINSKK